MGIQKPKVAIKAWFCILLVLLLVAEASFVEKKTKQEDFVSKLLDPASGLFDEHTVCLA